MFPISSGPITGKGMKVVIYGPEGIGKSTLASQFPSPLFIDTECSTKFMDVRRFENPPSSWAMLEEYVKYVRDHRELLRTLVIDTMDAAERICIKAVCDRYQKSGIEAFDYGKGYTFVYEDIGKLLNLLSEVAEHGPNVVITAHAATRRREQPDEFGSYDVWSLKLQDSAKCSVANMVKEWADLVLFANYKTYVVAADDKGKKHKAQGGQRVLYTTHHPCWDAKNRVGLPDELPMDFSQLAPYIPWVAEANAAAAAAAAQAPAPAVQAQAGQAAPPPAEKQEQAEQMSIPTDEKPEGRPAPDIEALAAAGVPEVLRPLMAGSGVSEDDLRDVIATKGYFPIDAPWSVMEESGFVEGWILPWWERIAETVKKLHNVPF